MQCGPPPDNKASDSHSPFYRESPVRKHPFVIVVLNIVPSDYKSSGRSFNPNRIPVEWVGRDFFEMGIYSLISIWWSFLILEGAVS